MRKKLFDKKNFGNSCGFSKLFASFVLVLSLVIPAISAEKTILKSTPYSLNLYISEKGTNSDYSYYTSTYEVQNGGFFRTYYKEDFNVTALNNTTLVEFFVIEENALNAIKINYFNNKTFWLNYSIDPSTIVNTDVYTILEDNEKVELLFSKALNGSISNSMKGVSIESIFIANYSEDTASSIQNLENANISKVNSTFVGNYSDYTGGAIYNNGEIYSIDSMFIGNYTSKDGGAIYNAKDIEIMNSDFIGNFSQQNGGAIYNAETGLIAQIDSNFIGNYTTLDGGVIYNKGTINTISSVFIGNYSELRGGAIYNEGTISTIRNSSFLQNSTLSRGAVFDIGNLGGAIYTNSSIRFEAVDGYVFEFTGNYVLSAMEQPIYQAIYVADKDAVLTFFASDGASFLFNDTIVGVSGYNVVLQGVNRENDSFKLFNQIVGANLSASNIRIDFTDGVLTNYSFITSNYDNVFLDFDISFDSLGQLSSDVISTDSFSNGVITIDKVNFIGENLDMEYLVKNQIRLTVLDTSSENLRLEVSDALEAQIVKFIVALDLPPERYSLLEYNASPDVPWFFVNTEEYEYIYGTKHAHIGVSDNTKFGFMYKYNTQSEMITDILAIINRANVDNGGQNLKSFYSENPEPTEYTVTEDLGVTEGDFTVRGYSSDVSTINLAGFKGFEIDKGSVLTLKDVKITGNDTALITAISHQGVLNLDGAYLDGNLAYTGVADNAYTINIIGEGNSTIAGSLSDVKVILQSGALTFGLDTFANENVSLEAVGGVINLADNVINEYNLSKLISSSVGVNYSMDIQVTNIDNTIVIATDILNIGKYSLGGAVKLNDINFINEPQSLKTNQSIIDIVNSVNTMYGVDVDVSSLDYISNIATTEDFIKYVFSVKNGNAPNVLSAGAKVLFSNQVGVENNNLMLDISEFSNGSDVIVSEYYRKKNSFKDFKDANGDYIVTSNDALKDDAYVIAFYRDILIDETSKGVKYQIKWQEVIDEKESINLGNVLYLLLKYDDVEEGSVRNFVLEGAFDYNPASSVDVTSGKVNIYSRYYTYDLNLNNNAIVLGSGVDLSLKDLNIKGLNLTIGAEDTILKMDGVVANGVINSDLDTAKIYIVGDGDSKLNVTYRGDVLNLQVGGNTADEAFSGSLALNYRNRYNVDVTEHASGVFDLSNNVIETYHINSLNINENAKTSFALDVVLSDFDNIEFDKINTGIDFSINERDMVSSDNIFVQSCVGNLEISEVNVNSSLTDLVKYISDRMTVTDKRQPPKFNFDVDVVSSNNSSGLNHTLSLSDKLFQENKFCTTSKGSENDIKVREQTSWNELFSFVVTVWYYQLGIKEADIFAYDVNDSFVNIGSLLSIGDNDFIKDDMGNFISLESGSYMAVDKTYIKDENGNYVEAENGNYIKFGTDKFYKFDIKYTKDEDGNYVEAEDGNYIKFDIQDTTDKLNVSVRGDVTVLKDLDTLYYVTQAECPKNPNHMVPIKSDVIDKQFVAPSYDSEYFFKLNNIKINAEDVPPETLGILVDNLLIKGLINPDDSSQRSTIYFKLDPNPPYVTDESLENKDKHYGGITIIDRRNEELEEGEVYQPQKFEANSVILRDAEIKGNGSVLNVLAVDAEIILRDVIIQDNKSTGLGGAIYTKSDISIFAENADTIFERNEQNSNSTSTPNLNYNDIYFAKDYTQEGAVQNLNLNAATGKTIVFLSGIDFDKNTKLVLNINPDVEPLVVEEGETPVEYNYNGTIQFNGDVAFVDKPLAGINFNGGTLSFCDDEFTSVYTSDFKITKETFLNIDVDLTNGKNDKIVLVGKDRLVPTLSTNNGVVEDFVTLVLNNENLNIDFGEKPVLNTKIQVLDILGKTSNFLRLSYEALKEGTGVEDIPAEYETRYIKDLNTGMKLDNSDYYIRLGMNGKLIVYSVDESLNNNAQDFLKVLDTYSKKAVSYKLLDNEILYNYSSEFNSDGTNVIGRYKELQPIKLTITGDYNHSISTPTSIEGITIAGVLNSEVEPKEFLITPNNQQFVGSKFTFEGFDGAIINKGGKVTLTNVNFIGNETEENGAGLRNLIYSNEAVTSSTYKGSITLKGTSKKYAKVHSNIATLNGGAIYNEGTLTLQYVQFGSDISDVDGSILKTPYLNHALNGGAVANIETELFNISANISNSKFSFNTADLFGGAVYNTGLLKTSKNIFNANNAIVGGAIYTKTNNHKDSAVTITSDEFINNTAVDGAGLAVEKGLVTINKASFGNTKEIGVKNGNVAEEKGGAIYNALLLTPSEIADAPENSTQTTVKSSKFYGNTAKQGGAIYNDENATLIMSKNTFGGSVTTKEKDLNGNSVNITRYYNNEATEGGAIYNNGIMTDSSSSFNDNMASKGGAIYNESRIVGEKKNKNGTYTDVAGLVSTKFISNMATNGGALYNSKDGYVWGNKVSFTTNSASLAGGAIYNNLDAHLGKTTIPNENGDIEEVDIILHDTSKITLDSATFKQNSSIMGGAVYNESEMTLNKSTFTQNSAKGAVVDVPIIDGEHVVITKVSLNAQGGAIYNNGSKFEFVNANDETIESVIKSTLNLSNTSFYGNYVEQITENSKTAYGYGGAIYNGEYGILNISKGTFGKKDTKTVKNSNSADFGGAIYNEGIVNIDSPKFTYNTANQGAAIYNNGVMTVGRTTFTSNNAFEIVTTTDTDGNPETTGDITVEITYGYGGAIYNTSEKDGNKVLGSTFSKNSATEGGAIYNEGKLDIDRYDLVSISKGKEKHTYYNNSFSSNTANKGGAIYNASETGMSINYATFSSNKATDISLVEGADVVTGQGGAIYIAEGSKDNVILNSTFSKNSATEGGAIYVGKDAGLSIIDTNFTNNTATKAGGAIFADSNSVVNIIAEAKDVLFKGNKVGKTSNAIHLNNATLNLLAQNGRKITINDYITGNGTVNSEGNVFVKNEDFIAGQSLNLVNSNFSIANNQVSTLSLRTLSLPNGTKSDMSIDFGLKNATSDKVQAEVVEGTGTLNVSSVNVVTNSKTPVEINVGKDSVVSSISTNKAESAEATYKLKSYYDENGLLRVVAYGQKAKPATVAAPVAAQIGGYLTQINSYDQAFMNMDMNMLIPRAEREYRHCEEQCDEAIQKNTRDDITYNAKGLWNRPFATFEKVNLNNGPKVSNVGYGNYFGGDADMKQLSNGWKRQFSAYVGYNGSVQDYERQSIDQNGGTVGVTEVWYKNNFFTGLTFNAGANVAQAHTDLGRENMPMFMTGLASKTGYNFEFKEGKFIVQPSMLVSYSFIHTFAHDNGLGHRVSSSPLHAIQLAPGVKFIANLKNGWQPYFNVNMRWNLIDKTHFSIPDVTIQDMSIDPYIEYGLGLQRRWGERFTGYGQAMIRNGGRNGVMLSFGFKWLIGK